MKYNFLFCVHTSFFIFYSFLHYPFSVSLSSLPFHLFFLPPQTHRPFFLPQRPIVDLHEPSRHRPVAVDPRSATDLTHFGLYSLFSTFRFCVSSCACVSALCFGLACVSNLCFGLHGFVFGAGFLFRAWVSVCGFDVWVTRFEFGGFRRLAVGFGVWLWLILWMWVCFVVCCEFVGDVVLVPWWWSCRIFFFFHFVCDW